MKLANYLFALSTATILTASCSSETDDIVSHDEDMIFATFSVSSENTSITRADLANLGQEFAGFRWDSNDLIAVSADNKSCFHNITVSNPKEDDATATAAGNVDKSSNGYLCVYPSTAAGTKVTNNKVNVSLPSSQTIEMQHSIAKNALLQVGYTKGIDSKISFGTPCSFLAFHSGANNIKSISVVATQNNQPYGIVGNIEVEVTETSSFKETSIGTSTNTVTCNYHDGQTCFPTDKYYAIAIRPGHPDLLQITVTYVVNSQEKTKVFKLTDKVGAQLLFDRAYYYRLPDFGTLN